MLDLQRPLMIRVLDTETTGLGDDAKVIEIGYVDLHHHGGGEWTLTDPVGLLINPGVSIPPEASAIHHIRDADVASAPPADHVFRSVANVPAITQWAAHNADYDRRFFGGGDRPWICTLKAVYRAFPGAPKHGNQTIRYYLGLDDFPDFDPVKADPPHRAGPDAYVTAFILKFILENGISADQLIDWTKARAELPRMPFGKHTGSTWKELPVDYLEWIVKQSDIDRDVKHCAKREIERRRLPNN